MALIDTLRTYPQKSRFYLSVIKPRTLLSAQVNGSFARGAQSVDYDTGTGTGFTDIASGQTLAVFTSAGTKYVRIKSVSGSQTSGTLTLAANSIVWVDNDVLAVYEDALDYPLISRFDSGGTFYKDWDTTYTDENLQPPPVCIAGCHQVGEMAAGSIVFNVDLSASYAIADGATISSYSLSVVPSGPGVSFNTGTGIGTVTVTTAGQYWMVAGCTDSNSKSQTTRRRLIAHDTNNQPYTEFSIDSLSGDKTRGGWQSALTVFGDADLTEFPENTLVLVWFDQWYGATQEYAGGPASGQNTLFAGYITRDSVEKNWNTGEVSFEAMTIDGLLRQHFMYALTLSAVASPSDWYEYALWLTPGRAIHHLWRFHSTLLEIADVFGLTADTRRRKYADMPQGNLFSMASNMLESIQAAPACNKQGQIYVERNIQLLNTAVRAAITTVAEIEEQDTLEDTVIGGQTPTTVMVNVSGLYFDGATITAYCAKAPGTTFENRGTSPIDVGQQVLSSQTDADELAGRVLAQELNPYPEVRHTFDGGWVGPMDIVPQQWWTKDLAAGDTPRGITWTDQKMTGRKITVQPDVVNGTMTLQVSFETEAGGEDGIPVDCISDLPLQPDRTAPDWKQEGDLPALVAFSDAGSGFYYRDDNDTDWTAKNGALSGANIEDHFGVLDPFWFTGFKNATFNPEEAVFLKGNTGKQYRSVDTGDNWDQIGPIDNPPNDYSDSPVPALANLIFANQAADIVTSGTFYSLAEWQNGSSQWRGWLLKTTNDGRSWTYYTLFPTSATQSRGLWADVDRQDGSILWVVVWRDGSLLLQKWTAATMTFVEIANLGNTTVGEMEAKTYTAAVYAPLGDKDLVFVYGRMNSPAGLSGVHHVIKSTDGGTSWANVENGWDTDYCGAFHVGPDDGAGNRNYYAARIAV